MTRRSRFTPRGPVRTLTTRERLRMGSLVLLLAIGTWAYFRAREPAAWNWLAKQTAPIAPPSSTIAPPPVADPKSDAVEPSGPNDSDPEQRAAFKDEAAALADHQPLAAEEMFAYWRLFEWARSTPFSELHQRARHGILFSQLFEAPSEYRGELVSLTLHVKRVLQHTADDHGHGRPTVYEAWAATDDSGTFPYCVVFPNAPPQSGDNLNAEAAFAGYFFKTMEYRDKLGARRGAPLLIGRLNWTTTPAPPVAPPMNFQWLIGLLAVGAIILLPVFWRLNHRRRITPLGTSFDDPNVTDWLDAAQSNAANHDDAAK